jgi:hypothetical protein
MEEDEYKLSYEGLASVRCVFEKALTNNQAKCSLSRHFCLADREGYACENAESSAKCRKVLEKLRENSIFVLKLREIKGSLPHNMEIRVQVGGITGLAKLVDGKELDQSKPVMVDDINGVLQKVIEKFGSLDNLPYREIIQSIGQFQGRRRRQR